MFNVLQVTVITPSLEVSDKCKSDYRHVTRYTHIFACTLYLSKSIPINKLLIFQYYSHSFSARL